MKVSDETQGTDPSKDLLPENAARTDEDEILAKYADVIEAARAKHDSIAIFQAPKGFEGIVIVAAPENPKVFQNFVNNVANEKTDKAVETQNFAMACVVYPDRVAVKAIFTKRQAFALKVAARAQELSGSEARELGKE